MDKKALIDCTKHNLNPDHEMTEQGHELIIIYYPDVPGQHYYLLSLCLMNIAGSLKVCLHLSEMNIEPLFLMGHQLELNCFQGSQRTIYGPCDVWKPGTLIANNF